MPLRRAALASNSCQSNEYAPGRRRNGLAEMLFNAAAAAGVDVDVAVYAVAVAAADAAAATAATGGGWNAAIADARGQTLVPQYTESTGDQTPYISYSPSMTPDVLARGS